MGFVILRTGRVCGLFDFSPDLLKTKYYALLRKLWEFYNLKE
ncbi:hypothetical protein EMIT0180MI3_20439 [Priestia megaterium]